MTLLRTLTADLVTKNLHSIAFCGNAYILHNTPYQLYRIGLRSLSWGTLPA